MPEKRKARRAAWRAAELPPGVDRRKLWRESRLPGSRRPFQALAEYMPLFQKAMTAPEGTERNQALAALPELRHRGHGGKYSYRR